MANSTLIQEHKYTVPENPLINAAGTCKSLEDVSRLSKTPIAAITVGSLTVELSREKAIQGCLSTVPTITHILSTLLA